MDLRIDLGGLQEKSAQSFEEWDDAVLDNDPPRAKRARNEVKYLAQQALSGLPTSYRETSGGLYLFTNEKSNCFASDHIIYVGLVWRQSLYTRMGNYFDEELSVLDPRLLELDEMSARATIMGRLSVAMPASKLQTIKGYVVTHMKSRSMSRADTVYLMSASTTKPVLEGAETVLIQAALSCGQQLVNKQKVKATKTAVRQESLNLALESLLAWRREGLDRQLYAELELAVQNR